jgi:hypothetical protein
VQAAAETDADQLRAAFEAQMGQMCMAVCLLCGCIEVVAQPSQPSELIWRSSNAWDFCKEWPPWQTGTPDERLP